MSDSYRRLGDGLGARRAPDSSTFPTDPRRVKAWVDALPRANQAATHKQLQDALASLVSVRLEGAQRLGVLDVLRPLALEAIAALETQIQGGTIPLAPAKARAYEQLGQFQRMLALSYRLAVIEYCAPSGGIPFLRGGNVAQALVRALYHGSRSLMHAYFMYQQPEAGSWRALHALYQFAEASKLEDKSVDEPAEQRALSASGLYIQALLIAFSNPFRFSQKDQSELWRLAAALGGALSLISKASGDDVIGVALDGDSGPGYIPAERVQAGDALLWIDLSGVRGVIDERLSAVESGNVSLLLRNGGRPIDTSVDMLRRLRAGWGKASARRNQRLSAGHVLETVLGLSSLHFYLAGLLDFDTFLERAGHGDGREDSERATWARGGVDAGRIPLARAEVMDQSLGGYHLRWQNDENAKARVGELVGMSVPASEDERHWLVGIVRWMRFDHDGSVDAGIELLSRRARAVALRGLDGAEAARPPQRGIQYQPVRDSTARPLCFAAPSALEAVRGRFEVVRVPDVSDIDEPVPMRETIPGLQVAENAGDYLLMQGKAKP